MGNLLTLLRPARGTFVAPLHDTHIDSMVATLREAIGAERWHVWFEGATDFHVTDTGLNVGVANLFISDHLKTHFADHLADAARKTFGRPLPITYRVQPDLFRKRRQANLEGEVDAMEQLGQSVQARALHAAQHPRPQARPPSRCERPARPLFTLDNFIVGPCNHMAYAAAKSAIDAPGKAFHPLFIHAGCGLGKTHLLQAILNSLRPRQNLRVACVSAEQFTNEYLAGMRTRRLDAFRHRYRNLDVLAIDDVHFLARKAATQEEFLHTFNDLDTQGRLVVLASDSHPRDIDAIQDRLISRWVAGLVVRIVPPERDTRRRILEVKAAHMGHPLPGGVLDLLADRLHGSVRDLEGALTRLIAYAALLRTTVTEDLARQVVAETAATAPKRTGLPEIEQTVAAFFGVTPSDIRSRRKARPVTLARQVTMVLARQLTDLSLAEIARGLGNKNHTTVLAACRKWDRLVPGGAEIAWTDRTDHRSMSAGALLEHLKDRVRR